MKIKKEKILIISVVFILLILIMFQLGKTKSLISQKMKLESAIKKQQLENSYLKTQSQNKLKSIKSKQNNPKINLEAESSEILKKLNKFDLKLIDFSSNQKELNLNLSGDFHSFLTFIYHLENKINKIEIIEFKIKNVENQLFFFLKLKNELI